jgi:hypothetical protein
MKKFNKILIIIAIILVFLGATLLIFKQNKKDDDIPNEESLINFNISNDIEHETSFISNNTYLVVVLKNNSNTNIIKANLKVNFTSEEVNEEINMFLKDNKTLVLVKIPDNLINNILNEKIKITLDVIKEGNTNIIDISSLNKNIKYNPSLSNEYININIDGNNTTSKDIKLLMGNIIMYKNNKIVEAKTFGIENIKSKSNFSKVVSFSNVNYDKIEVYYTFAY